MHAMVKASRLVLFSGGGSAGHLAPGFALADELRARGIATRFATPGEPVEQAWFDGREPPVRIPAARLPKGIKRALVFPFRSLRGLVRARRLLSKERPGCVVALGGWPCAPAALAARMKRVPLVLLVPDRVPGLVARRIAPWAGRIYASDPGARRALGESKAVRVTGPLLRDDVQAGVRDPEAFGLEPGRRTLFVTGGSLGSRALNKRFLAGLEAALEADPDFRTRIQILHSTGADGESVVRRYDALGVLHCVVPFVQEMGAAYATADLVLARAGANTCAELQATATPCVLVPYPHHPDRQQFLNAEPLVAAGGARLIEEAVLDAERIREVLGLLEDPEALARMRTALRNGQADAAAETAEDLVRFLNWDQ